MSQVTPTGFSPQELEVSRSAWRSDKIRSEHRDRLAVVYVRQSTQQQVLHHQESTRLQYGLRLRAQELGWDEERVLVIDDDLGKSGASAVGRAGFQRLVSEVTLGNVGIILGVEMSRLARSCKDWHQLLEACGLFGCLIADLDGVYEPSNYNDRLLLGLKGTMSEAELHILKQRLHQGKLTKARRGALGFAAPIGYMRRPSGEVALDPDEQVRDIVRLVFQVFEERGTLNATLRYLVDHGIKLGVRLPGGPAKGDLEWRRPSRMTLQNILRSPTYAGVYAYGRRRTDPRRKKPGSASSGRTVTPREDWYVLIPEHHPAYITWERYEANLAQLRANRSVTEQSGVPRVGAALVAGLLVCGKCGCRMSVRYCSPGPHAYTCGQMESNYGSPHCQHVSGPALDRFLEARALEALAPASLDLALEAAENVEQERTRLNSLWVQKLERAAYEVERASRQYHRVEPENRLVARQLELDWEARLAEQRTLTEEHRRFLSDHPRGLSELEREAIRRLADDIPSLWHAPITTQAERKEILRQIVDRVVVDVQGSSEEVRLEICWAGGSRTHHTMTRPVARLEQLTYFDALCDRVRAMHTEGFPAQHIAERLNAEGFRPPKRSAQFGRTAVQELLLRLGLGRPRRCARGELAEHEWWLRDLAAEIPMPLPTLYVWAYNGVLRSRRTGGERPGWVVWADPGELQRLRDLHRRPPGRAQRDAWARKSADARADVPRATA